MAAGAVLFLTEILKANGALITAFWYIAEGVGVWIGVQLCMKIFPHKMEKNIPAINSNTAGSLQE